MPTVPTRRLLAIAALLLASVPALAADSAGAELPRTELRVCSDPNNLPFSNQREQGFENRIAEVLARDLGARLSYTWWPQRRAFLRSTLRAYECDLVMGVPSSLDLVLPTRPYYRSSYVFVYRGDAPFHVSSLDDPVLRRLRVGVQLIGDDGANTPPAHALSRRGITANVVGYRVYGDYSQPDPPARIIDAVARGEVDLAIAWGPLAGYFAARQPVPLRVVPVSPQVDLPFLPMVYDISLGVRRGDSTFHGQLERALRRRAPEIRRILDQYGVPEVPGAS